MCKKERKIQIEMIIKQSTTGRHYRNIYSNRGGFVAVIKRFNRFKPSAEV